MRADAATEAAQRAENAALNARCAANPREAANFAARLRRTPRDEKERLLFKSALLNHVALVRLLLADGLSPNTTLSELGNSTPMHSAAREGGIDVVRLLLEAGADANSCNCVGNTPLAEAIATGELACTCELIPHTNPRIFNVTGNNVLHDSIICNHLEIFKLLMPCFVHNVDVRTVKPRPPCDPDGPYNFTPLHTACQGGHHAMVKALLAAGASRTAHNSNSFSCLHAAAQEGHLACVTMLIGRPENQKMSPAEIDARNVQGRTPLILAAQCGHRYCCAALLAAGADPSAVTPEGHTALDIAKYCHPGNQELIELLECCGGGPAPLLCAGCGASDKRLRVCSACGSASFCSAACMAQFWPVHKAECKSIQAARRTRRRLAAASSKLIRLRCSRHRFRCIVVNYTTQAAR